MGYFHKQLSVEEFIHPGLVKSKPLPMWLGLWVTRQERRATLNDQHKGLNACGSSLSPSGELSPIVLTGAGLSGGDRVLTAEHSRQSQIYSQRPEEQFNPSYLSRTRTRTPPSTNQNGHPGLVATWFGRLGPAQQEIHIGNVDKPCLL